MRARLGIVICVFGLAAAAAAQAAGGAVTEIRAVYRTVLTAEYFGPAKAMCSNLTASGVKSFTAGGIGACPQAFEQTQHLLRYKTKGVDDSGYTAHQWRRVVSNVMAHLKVRVLGTRAIAIGGQSGIPGQTTLLEVGGKWLFSSYPPSIEP